MASKSVRTSFIAPFAAGLILALMSAQAWAATACPQFFAQQQPPAHIATVGLPAGDEQPLCFLGYAITYAPDWRDPLWSAEHIKTASAELALANKRVGSFHVCAELEADVRSTNADYSKSGYDKGHMTPVGDFGDPDLEKDTFRLCNMVPQTPALNERIWAGIEEAVLRWAVREGDVCVVTGPIVPASPQRLRDRVAVPSHTWKAVYSPATGAGAYLCSNIDQPVCSAETVADLTRQMGVDPFPGLDPMIKATLIALPPPTRGGALASPP